MSSNPACSAMHRHSHLSSLFLEAHNIVPMLRINCQTLSFHSDNTHFVFASMSTASVLLSMVKVSIFDNMLKFSTLRPKTRSTISSAHFFQKKKRSCMNERICRTDKNYCCRLPAIFIEDFMNVFDHDDSGNIIRTATVTAINKLWGGTKAYPVQCTPSLQLLNLYIFLVCFYLPQWNVIRSSILSPLFSFSR